MGSCTIHLFAGQRPDGEQIYEAIEALELEDSHYLLSNSPAFCKGIAAGDIIQVDDKGSWRVVKHGGNVCIRVFARDGMMEVAQRLVEGVAMLQGRVDVTTERVMVFTVAASKGFAEIENTFNLALDSMPDVYWLYGNVYDPEDGRTPLNWWLNSDRKAQ